MNKRTNKLCSSGLCATAASLLIAVGVIGFVNRDFESGAKPSLEHISVKEVISCKDLGVDSRIVSLDKDYGITEATLYNMAVDRQGNLIPKITGIFQNDGRLLTGENNPVEYIAEQRSSKGCGVYEPKFKSVQTASMVER